MERKLSRWGGLCLTAGAAVAGYFLRLRQLGQMYDTEGYVIAGAGKGALTWLCLAAVVLFALLAWRLRPRTEYAAMETSAPGVLLLSLLGAVGMVLGSAAMVLDLERSYDVLLAAGGIVTAICWAVAALDRARGRRIPAMLLLIPVLFLAVELVLCFRDWSKDPAVLDYCFDLFAQICIMCACFHLSGFCFDRGQRRHTVFFTGCAVLFGAISVAGGRLRELCMTGGAVLWLIAGLWPLLEPEKKDR